MLLKMTDLEAIKSGKIDIVFRRWKRATVKPGGTLKTKIGVLAIGAMTPLTADQVTLPDARRAGFRDLAHFDAWLATMKEGDLVRIEVSYAGPRQDG